LIEDLTPSTSTEMPLDGVAGADIAAIYLVDETDQPIGFADTLVARDAAGERVISPLVGQPVALDAEDQCVQTALGEETVSLGGEGGYLLVRFVTAEGMPIDSPPSQWRVVVIEWGDNCDPLLVDSAESVRARGCEAMTYDSIEFDTDCAVEFGQPFHGKAILEPTGGG
jgi:hypothetical protein